MKMEMGRKDRIKEQQEALLDSPSPFVGGGAFNVRAQVASCGSTIEFLFAAVLILQAAKPN